MQYSKVTHLQNFWSCWGLWVLLKAHYPSLYLWFTWSSKSPLYCQTYSLSSSSIQFILTFHWVGLQTHFGYQCKLNQPYSFHSLCWLSSLPICFYSNCKALFYTWLFQPKYSRMFCLGSQGRISEGWNSGVRIGHLLEGCDGGGYRSGKGFYPL